MHAPNSLRASLLVLLPLLFILTAVPFSSGAQEVTKSGVALDEPPPPPKPKPKPRKPRNDSLDGEQERMYARAVEGARWGMPIVSVWAMREAFFRDAEAQYGDVVYWSKFADWKVQFTTPNASTYYVYLNFNTKNGPVVIDIPPAVGAGLFGSMEDAWQKPLMDIGPEGEDKGNGGKYLILPPGYEEKIPKGYIPVRSETYNGYAIYRVIPATGSDPDRLKGVALVQKIRVYPLSKASTTRETKYIDMSGRLFDGIVSFDASFYDKLAMMVNEEPILERDMVALAQLRTLGIEKGKNFRPDSATRKILGRAIEDAHEDFMDELVDSNEPFWKATHWGLPKSAGPSTQFSFITKDRFYDIDGRAVAYFFACAPPKKLGAASFYAAAFEDVNSRQLDGDQTYVLRVPPNVPAKQYWSVCVYDLETAAFFKDAPVISLDSYNSGVKKNDDGSVDIYFGPKAPEGQQSNWIYTKPGKDWCTLFRIYGPEEKVFDKTWNMGDIRPFK